LICPGADEGAGGGAAAGAVAVGTGAAGALAAAADAAQAGATDAADIHARRRSLFIDVILSVSNDGA
jgi:hypothetical protein